MDKNLLIDEYIIDNISITDGKENTPTTFKGKAQLADKKNGNKRIYPTKVLESALSKIKDDLKLGKITAQLGHPDFFQAPNFDKAVAIITNAELEDGVVYIEGRFIDNDATKNLLAYKRAGGFLGISARGYGSADYDEEQDAYIIKDDYEIKGWDFVIDPAVPDARVIKMDEKGNLHINKEELSVEIKTLQDLKYHYPELVGILESNHNKEVVEIKDNLKAVQDEKEVIVNELNAIKDEKEALVKELEEVKEAKKSVEDELATIKFNKALNDLLADHKYKEYITIPEYIKNIEDAKEYVDNETAKLDAFKESITAEKVDDNIVKEEAPEASVDVTDEEVNEWDSFILDALELGKK